MYANTKDECWFCPLTAGREQMEAFGLERSISVTPAKVVEALSIARDGMYGRLKKYIDKKVACGQMNCRCLGWILTGGSMYDAEKEALRYIPYIEAVREALPDINIYVETQACSGKAAERLARAGLHGIQYNMEVYDKKMFYYTCPGKGRNITWEGWLERLAEAVPYYERGHVYSNQVLGLELVPPEGFKALEQAKESVLEGHDWMTRHGVAPSWTPFITFNGTKIENVHCPPTEYYLEIGIETHRMTLERKLYAPSRGFFCYRLGLVMGGADFARLRWGEVKYNEYRDPCMIRGEEPVGAIAR